MMMPTEQPEKFSPMQTAAMVCIQLEKGTPKEKIHESIDFDDEFDVGIQFFVEFAIENDLVLNTSILTRHLPP